jgi:aspartate/glutamate racemase
MVGNCTPCETPGCAGPTRLRYALGAGAPLPSRPEHGRLTKHIGIVAVSPEGAALCYRQIFRHATQLLPRDGHPKLSLHNHPLETYLKSVRQKDWRAVGDLLRQSAHVLAGAGADFCFTPDNAIQHGVHLAETGSPIPWLSMVNLVADALVLDGRKVSGLIGAELVTGGSTYQTHLGLKGIQVLTPPAHEARKLDDVIFRELVYGQIKPASQRVVLAAIESLADRGCDSVILATSEAPLLVTPENSPLPVYDAADILAAGAVRRSMEADL